MKSKFIYLVIFIAVVIITFGFLLPYLFSANTDIAIIGGYVVLAMFVWYVGWNIVMVIKWIMNFLNSK